MADYFVEGGDVLENKFDISDPIELRETEEFYFSEAASDIIMNFNNAEIFDFDFLKELHKKLFGEVYAFAGKIRTVNITKTDSNIPFCFADYIETEADKIFVKLASKNYLRDCSLPEFSLEIAKLSAELNALHPFREGNGRTIRFFLQLLARKNGYILDYSLVSHEVIIAADKEAFLGNFGSIEDLYKKVISEIK